MASMAYKMSGLSDIPDMRTDCSDPVHMALVHILSGRAIRLTQVDVPDIVDTQIAEVDATHHKVSLGGEPLSS